MDYTYYKEILHEIGNTELKNYPNELDKVIEDTARSGIVRFSWNLLKPLLRARLQTVLDHGFEGQECKDDERLCDHLFDRLDKFIEPPFTIQRVCELITQPKKHYKRIGAYMRAMERNLLVVSTQDPNLTWMKSPRLTQLLEGPVNETTITNNDVSGDQDPKSCDQNTNGQPSCDMAPDSPTAIVMDTIVMDTMVNGVESRSNRKRKSCDEESTDEEGKTILQEADSTTTVDTERPPTSDNTLTTTNTHSEETPAKRLKHSDAATNEDTAANIEGIPVVTSAHDSKVQNESTGQAETCLDTSSI